MKRNAQGAQVGASETAGNVITRRNTQGAQVGASEYTDKANTMRNAQGAQVGARGAASTTSCCVPY